jgi:hypothetical protein
MRFTTKGKLGRGIGFKHNIQRVRAVPLTSASQYFDWSDYNTGTPIVVGGSSAGFELMHYLNSTKLGEGAWIVKGSTAIDQSAIELVNETTAPPGTKGQLGDVFDIHLGDVSMYDHDNDGISLLEIKCRAHFCYEENDSYDGSIAFDTADPGADGTTKIYGRMRPATALKDTWGWKRESCKWVPSVGLPDVYWFPEAPLTPVPGPWSFSNDVAFYDNVTTIVNGAPTYELSQYLIGRVAGDDAFAFIIPDEGDHQFGFYVQDIDTPYTDRVKVASISDDGLITLGNA